MEVPPFASGEVAVKGLIHALFVIGTIAGVGLGGARAAPGEEAPAVRSADEMHGPELKSSAAVVVEQGGGPVLYAKNVDAVVPIASITKLMTAMVVLDAGQPLNERITITSADLDDIKGTRSRLKVGTTLTRSEMLQLALMSSENRAAAALGRNFPGGTRAFVAAMNQKAIELGMWHSRFVDGTGLSSENVSTAQELVKLAEAAYQYPEIRRYTTESDHKIRLANGKTVTYRNSNGLIWNPGWTIGLSKTGYISEAGRCLVIQAQIAAKPVIIVLLDSWGRLTRIGDANRIKRWMESHILERGIIRPGG
jgi:D-alanyl-D-alanine endopeptidase (penicillin-binding protein 7)